MIQLNKIIIGIGEKDYVLPPMFTILVPCSPNSTKRGDRIIRN
jgi:hypothetical protein